MTSKNCYSEFQLVRDCMRRNLWSIVLSGLAFFLTLLLPTMMLVQNTLQRQQRGASFDTKSIVMMLTLDNPFVKLAFIGIAVLCGIAAFAYLHSRKQVDFYHSLPISRSRLYVTNLIAGVLSVVPMYLIMLVLSLIVAAVSGIVELPSLTQIGYGIIGNLICFLLLYALSALSTILCGNTIISILLLVWMLFSLGLIPIIQSGLFELFFDHYVEDINSIWLILMPALQYFDLVSAGSRHPFYDVTADAQQGSILLVYLLVAAAVFVLGLVLFRIRKSERAGMALAFEPSKLPIKIFMVLFIGTVCGLAFWGVSGQAWFWFGLVFGVVLMHMIVEIIYAFDFRAIRKHWKHMAALCVVLVAGMLALSTDLIGFDRWIPDRTKVAGMLFESYDNDVFLTEESNVDLIYELAQIGLATDMNQPGGEYRSYRIRYLLKNGKKVWREYFFPKNTQTDALIERLSMSEEYKRKCTELFRIATPNEQTTPTLDLYNNLERKTTRDSANIWKVIETLREDTLARTKLTAPVLLLELEVEDMLDYSTRFSQFYVTAEDTRTLALIKQLFDIEPVPFTTDSVDYMILETGGIYNEQGMWETHQAEITDPQDIAALLDSAISNDRLGWGENWQNGIAVETPENCSIIVVLRGNYDTDRTTLAYPLGKVPYDVINKYLDTLPLATEEDGNEPVAEAAEVTVTEVPITNG